MGTSSRQRGMKIKSRKRNRREKDGKHYKVPGFDAFSPHDAPSTVAAKGNRKKSKLVPCEVIAEPETGIHSFAWAASIVPQKTGFLKLPYEVRVKIYEYAIEDFSCGDQPIEPRKKGNKFWSPGWGNIAEETTKLYQLSRQVYVDFVGSSLLYKFKPFTFDSPTLLLNYLCVINPVHKNAIRSITLNIHLGERSATLPSKAFNFLAECQGLEELNIYIHLQEHLVSFALPSVHAQTGTYLSTWSFKKKNLEQRIRTCESLRSIKGLKRFGLVFVGPRHVYWGPPIVRHVGKIMQSEMISAFVAEMKALMEGAK